MKTIAILTSTRAEYGLLSPIVKALIDDGSFNVKVLVTGTHLSEEHGYTYCEIENDGVPVACKIPILSGDNTSKGVSYTMANGLTRFAEYFSSDRPDALVVLGDRYETLSICIAAMNERIPIVHLHGGETTEGAVDEAIRHAITKMSYLHLTSTDEHRNRVIQLGESPDRVFNVGAIGVENVLKQQMMSRKELSESIGLDLSSKYAVVTFHPVTLEKSSAKVQCQELIYAISECSDYKYIITKANADADGNVINNMFEQYVTHASNAVLVSSLGMKRYLSAVKYSSMVIGNSSSGIIEVPSFGIPTINIGDRQKGRLQAKSIINCEPERESIVKAIRIAESNEFIDSLTDVINPYGDGNTSQKIVDILKDRLSGHIDLKKPFYDL